MCLNGKNFTFFLRVKLAANGQIKINVFERF